jgi:RecB family exonuclease
MPRQRTYSPSRLAVFQTCRAQYRYRYVLGIRTPPGPRATFGANLHRTLHQLHLGGGAAVIDAAAARQHLEATWSSAGFASAAASEEALGEARDLLDRYHARWGGEETTPVLLERRLTAPYRDHTFLGILDRVDRQPAGLVILDYKSGKAPERSSAALEQQLAIYHHLVSVHLNEEPVAHRVHYLADDVRRDVALAPGRVAALLDHAHDTAAAIETETTFAPQPGQPCSNCDFTWRCRRDHPGITLPS